MIKIFVFFYLLYFVKAEDCNFQSKSYCGNTYFGIDNINITEIKENNFCVSADIFSKTKVCNNETFHCSNDGSILFSNSSSDCLTSLFNQYGLDLPSLKYNNETNVINIVEEGLNIELNKC